MQEIRTLKLSFYNTFCTFFLFRQLQKDKPNFIVRSNAASFQLYSSNEKNIIVTTLLTIYTYKLNFPIDLSDNVTSIQFDQFLLCMYLSLSYRRVVINIGKGIIGVANAISHVVNSSFTPVSYNTLDRPFTTYTTDG